MAAFGPPALTWDGGVNSLDQKVAKASFYQLLSFDAGPSGTGASITTTTQNAGYQIQASSSWFNSVVLGGACVLPETTTPVSLAGVRLLISNTSLNTITCYPHPFDLGALINGASTLTIPAGSTAIVHCFAPGKWFGTCVSGSLGVGTSALFGASFNALSAGAQSYLNTGTTYPTNVVLGAISINPVTGSNTGAIQGTTEYTLATSGNTPASVYGATFSTPGNSVTLNHTRAGDFDNIMLGTGTVTQMEATTHYVQINSGTVGTMAAVNALMFGIGGTVTNAYGLWVSSISGISATKIVGLKVESIGGGALAIETSDPVHFAGLVRADSQITVGNISTVQFIDGVSSGMQIAGVAGNWGTSQIAYTNVNGANGLSMAKTRNASPTAHTIVLNNDQLGVLGFYGSDGAAFQEAAFVEGFVDGSPALNSVPGRLAFFTNIVGQQFAVERMRVSNNGLVSFTNGVGFGYGLSGNGDGGTVTQATNKSTTVVLSKVTGQITMNAAALAASTTVSFTLTNTLIATNDVLVLQHTSGGTQGAYTLDAFPGSGSAVISVRNVSLGSLSEAIVITFFLMKAVVS